VLFARLDGTPARLHTAYVVGCDGMHSTVREHTGIEFLGDRYPQSFLPADVRMDWPLSRQSVYRFSSPQGLVVVGPLPEDRFRVVATMDTAPERPTPADVQALLDARGPAAPRRRSGMWCGARGSGCTTGWPAPTGAGRYSPGTPRTCTARPAARE
jgi:2-polyprenyl-6-methoxyphenol hydroxylase-like FAD-dependent oxidoreductase